MKKFFKKATFILIILIIFPNTAFSQQLFIWGNVKWNTGTPAIGIELRLVKNNITQAIGYTNQAGRYAFFDINGQPLEYMLMVFSGNANLSQISLANIPVGGRVPDIEIQ